MNENTEKTLADLSGVVDSVVEHIDKLESEGAVASTLAESYARLRELVDDFELISERLGEAHRKMREKLIPAAFEREDIQSFTTKSGNRVTVSTKLFASIVKEVQDEAYEWLRKNGLGDIIKPTVNASTLSAAAKELVSQAKELPPDMFKVAVIPTTSFTKAKGKKS